MYSVIIYFFHVQIFVVISEELHRHINEKVDSGELPQASFKQSDKETKKKNKREKDYLERKKGGEKLNDV